MSRDLRIVVAGHSLRPDSEPVARLAIALARSLRGRAELVHAYTPLRHQLRVRGPASDLISWRRLHDQLLAELHRQAESLGVGDTDEVGWHVEAGPPHQVINQVAAAIDADLLVVGPAESGALRRGALGSTVNRLLHTANRPVLIARGEMPVPPRRVLAAVDFSTHAVEAWHAAQLLLDDMPGAAAELEVLTVLEPDEVQQPLAPEQLDEFVRAELARLVVDHLGHELPELEVVVRRGDPRDVLLREIEARGTELLVLGAHGRAGSDRFHMIGRVAHDLARRAPCSVLVVPVGAVWVTAAQKPSRPGGRRDR